MTEQINIDNLKKKRKIYKSEFIIFSNCNNQFDKENVAGITLKTLTERLNNFESVIEKFRKIENKL